jgi:hypothetical protein
MAADKKLAKLTDELEAARDALDKAQRAYTAAAWAYKQRRAELIKAGAPLSELGPLAIGGVDGTNTSTREAVLASNAELDKKAGLI